MSTPPTPPKTTWWQPTWGRLLGLSVAFFLVVLAFMGGRLAFGSDPGLKGGGGQVATKTSDDEGDSGSGLGVVDQVLSAVTGDDSGSDDAGAASSSDGATTDGSASSGGSVDRSADPSPPTTQAS